MSEDLAAPVFVSARGIAHERFSVAAPVTSDWPEAITRAFNQHAGARYFRCALQVNTPLQGRFKGFESRHARHSAAYKRDYGLALAQKCKKVGIDVVGICDHNSVEYVEAVRKELTQEGLHVFPGFEVASTEGLHLLCLFDPSVSVEELDHVLTELGLPPKERWVSSPGLVPKQSPRSFPQIIEHVQRKRRGICIAAHMDRENGLLLECAKTTRVQYFTDPNLLVGQISGSPEELMPFHRKVLGGELNHYQREHPLALLNCLDVYNLKDLGQPACSSLIKMSSPSIDGLWQAFLDPESRLRLYTEDGRTNHRRPPAAERVELVALCWEDGFLKECGLRFNENLNCLIGGRGTGKSSVIESLRYVLGQTPLGELARKTHDEIIEAVIRPETKITLLVRTFHPAPNYYRIERRVSEEPVVFDENGKRTELKVFDILPPLDIYGQHEISEIARDPVKQRGLLKRFRPAGAAKYEAEKNECLHVLAKNREDILRARREAQNLEDKLSQWPALEEKLLRYNKLGAEEKLRALSLLEREGMLVRASRERAETLRKITAQAAQKFEAENWIYEDKPDEPLPHADLIKKMVHENERMAETVRQTLAQLEDTLQQGQQKLLGLARDWETRRRELRESYQKVLQQLQKEAVDANAYMRLRRELAELEPMRLQREHHLQRLRELENKRKRFLLKMRAACDHLAKIDRAAAQRVSTLLEGKVRVTVAQNNDNESLLAKLRPLKKGKNLDFFEKFCEKENFNLAELIAALRAGPEALREKYGFNAKQAALLSNMEEGMVLALEETPTVSGVGLEHNVALAEEEPVWKKISELSTGQRATAILLMLFPESGAPLVIDQPEDDLDNRFIAEQVIPMLRKEKQRRQFLFATHNANLPVLGDAELIVALEAAGDSRHGRAQILEQNLGAIDRESVKLCVEQVLEGGKDAFEKRRAKYGF
jgi:energy-coupling factor transporter ATP-binding protein EcfA2